MSEKDAAIAINQFMKNLARGQTIDQLDYHISHCGLCQQRVLSVVNHTRNKLDEDGV